MYQCPELFKAAPVSLLLRATAGCAVAVTLVAVGETTAVGVVATAFVSVLVAVAVTPD